MLSSPVRRGTPVLAFCAGLVGGGLATAAVLLVVGSLARAPVPEPARWVVAGAACCAVLLSEWGVLPVALPENKRLVPDSVFRLGRHLGPLQFGVEMGTGVRTYLPSGLPYAAAVAVLLTASVLAALCAGTGFGLGRALMTMSSLRYRGDNGGEDSGWHDEWRLHRRRLAVMTSTTFAVCLAALIYFGLSGTP